MKISKTNIKDAFVIEPKIFQDSRGTFMETWNEKEFSSAIGKKITFVQDNHSYSKKFVLRGLHYQKNYPQGKLVRVGFGKVLDVAVDLRRSSPTFGYYHSEELSYDNKKQFWIPEGCAHGFIVLSDSADFLYKTTSFYNPEDEETIKYDDVDLKIDWRIPNRDIIISDKDNSGISFKDAYLFE